MASALTSARYSVRLARRLREIQPDVVHTNSLKSALYGGAAARIARVPCVWHIRDRIADDYLPSFAVSLVRLAARRVPAQIIVNSRATQDALGPRVAALVISDTAEGAITRRAASTDLAAPSDDRRPQSKQAGPIVIGMLGRLSPWKGQDVFLRAFALAFPEGDTRGVIVGSPLFGEEEYERMLVSLAAELGIAERIEFAGFQEDVAGQLARFDLLVHASTIPEPFGQVVVEGMAAGLPVIATDAGGPAEIIHSGVDGLLYPPGDHEALALLLRQLARDPLARHTLGEAGFRSSRAYTAEAVAPLLVDVYRSLATN